MSICASDSRDVTSRSDRDLCRRRVVQARDVEDFRNLVRFRAVIVYVQDESTMTNSPSGDPLMGVRDVDRNDFDLDALYRQHADRLIHLAASITFDRAVAEEVVQEAFVGLHQTTNHIHNPGGYLRRSVVNLSIKSIRRRQTAGRYRPPPQPTTSIPEIDEGWDAVQRLAPRRRAVVALRYWEDLTSIHRSAERVTGRVSA
jgi:Sigma-70 region 2